MPSLAERVAANEGGLRTDIQWAIRCGVPPTVFLRERTVDGPWTDRDTAYVRALAEYEAGLCPGCQHPLAVTSRPDHADAYRPGKPIRCHYCTAEALVAEVAGKKDASAGLLTPLVLDPAVVELNRRPVPPLPPELSGLKDNL